MADNTEGTLACKETQTILEKDKEVSLWKELVELCNILGVENLATEFDFDRPANEILADTDFAKAAPPVNREKIEADENGKKELMIRIAHQALLTAYERLIPELTDAVEEGIEKINRTRTIGGEKGVKRDRANEARKILKNDLPFPDDPAYYLKTACHSFLRVHGGSVELNCISQSAWALSVLLNIGFTRTDVRVALAGFHSSIIYLGLKLKEQQTMQIYDPRPNHCNHASCFNDIPSEKFFRNYNVEGIETANDFTKETDHLGMLKPDKKEGRQKIHFLPPEEGILAAIYTNLGRVAQQNGDAKKAERYYQTALMFDPDNSYVANARS